MADISFKKEEAKQWILDVEQELRLVQTVLDNVSTACQSVPGDEDTIMNGIRETGRTMEAFWSNMCSGFQKTTAIVSGVINKIGDTGDKVVEHINEVKSKIGR